MDMFQSQYYLKRYISVKTEKAIPKVFIILYRFETWHFTYECGC